MTHSISNVPVALLAGGLATRLRPITEKIPKALVELAGKPFIDHQLALLHRNGIRRVVMCLGYRGEMVQDHCDDGSRYDMDLAYSFDGEKLMGTGGAIARAKHLLGATPDDVLWVMYGDSYMDIDYRAVLDAFTHAREPGDPVPGLHISEAREETNHHEHPQDQIRGGVSGLLCANRNHVTDRTRSRAPGLPVSPRGLMTVLKNGNRWDTSNVVFQDGALLKYDKKNRTPDMDYIDYGVALLRMEAVDRIPTDRPFDLAELYTSLVQQREMIGYEVFERFYEIGTPAALEEAKHYLQSRGEQD